ncbi:hypothetical protein J7U46_17320 [Pelomonas sp. V22]|uniref:hypothetical protein n=1 Tax=Pelomonas sp. V22 TaxID=2822139 RepID=UPI0024A90EB3|nr:hypothetical protein [Pelomonas sp. V22]MDI4634825.1 hypothetical protein [Pelomonas sp. V22]
MTTTKRFTTLMQREWMQHRIGWMVVMALLPAITLVAMPFQGSAELGNAKLPPASLLALMIMGGTAAAVFGLSWFVAMFQLPGLARRDQQDRTIEFWMSLPASHSESVAATLLTHAVLVPIAALAVGLGFGLIVGLASMFKLIGVAALSQVSWITVIGTALVGVLRMAFGVLLMTLWTAPMFMILMAASAWLKRWGVPAVIGALVIGGNVLDKVYGIRIVGDLLKAQFQGAGHALFNASNTFEGRTMKSPDEVGDFLNNLATWALQDAGAAVQQLASPHLIGGLLVAAGCFYLVILARKRST